jgi:GNAT superfamily N-acetyltransferase
VSARVKAPRRAATKERGIGAAAPTENGEPIVIRAAAAADVRAVIALDEEVTGLAKPAYWKDLFERYGPRGPADRFFLVAARGERIDGFVIGEVRSWEFGSPPCGWVFAIQVRPRGRLRGLGTQLLDALCDAFRRAGVDSVRTMVPRESNLMLSFFRSQGLTAGPNIQLEASLE